MTRPVKNFQKILYPLLCLTGGLASGILSKLLDIHTSTLGNIFSEFSIWILLGVVISIYSVSPGKAAIRVFLFCAGMLAAYYFTAAALHSPVPEKFLYGWGFFSLCSPLFAWITWYSKTKKPVSYLISFGIIGIALLASVIFFHGPRFYDIVIILLLIFLLFIKKM